MPEIALVRRMPTVIGHTLVDEVDVKWISKHSWTISDHGYVVRGVYTKGVGTTTHTLHRTIMGLASRDPRTVDHINRDPLDNRRENLRIIPHGGQSQNRGSRPNSTSKFRGVHFCNREQKWVAKVAGKFLGYYLAEHEAAAVAKAHRLATMEFAVD